MYFFFTDYAKAFNYVDHNKLWKILKEMGIPDHITCFLRNLYVSQESTMILEPKKINLSLLPLVPLLFAMKQWDWMP